MAHSQQFDRLCRVVALIIRRLLEADGGAPGETVCASEDAGEAPPRWADDAGHHPPHEEVVE